MMMTEGLDDFNSPEHVRSRLDTARSIKAESELFAQIIESLPDGLVLVDSNGIIIFINKQAELIFGWDRKELVGKPHSLLIIEEQHEIHDMHRITYQRNPHVRAMGT